MGWLENPTSEQMKRVYDKQSEAPIVTKDDEKDFIKRGYTKEQVKRIKENLENAGYRQPR